MLKRLLLLILALCVAVLPALAEDDFDATIDDLIIEEETDYNGVAWSFPVDLTEMDPIFIMLANDDMVLPKSFVPDPLVKVRAIKTDKNGNNTNGGLRKASGAEMKLEGTCYSALVTMFDAAASDGIYLYLKSAYRSYQTQRTMYYNRLEKNNGKDDGWVQKPGCSDHQTGLGCDIVSKSWRDKAMNGSFGKTKEAQWMAEHCAEYGFILRYPSDKEAITKINYEPWHLRYVGVPTATYMYENGLCLEEFCVQLNDAIDAFIADGGSHSIVEPFIQVSAQN